MGISGNSSNGLPHRQTQFHHHDGQHQTCDTVEKCSAVRRPGATCHCGGHTHGQTIASLGHSRIPRPRLGTRSGDGPWSRALRFAAFAAFVVVVVVIVVSIFGQGGRIAHAATMIVVLMIMATAAMEMVMKIAMFGSRKGRRRVGHGWQGPGRR